jgi:hypothetical protein
MNELLHMTRPLAVFAFIFCIPLLLKLTDYFYATISTILNVSLCYFCALEFL